jgi:hypothetical protein
MLAPCLIEALGNSASAPKRKAPGRGALAASVFSRSRKTIKPGRAYRPKPPCTLGNSLCLIEIKRLKRPRVAGLAATVGM